MTEPTATPAPTIYAGVVGRLEEFDPTNDSMAAYIDRAMIYMDANNIPAAKRAATFLSALGKTTFEVLRNLVTPAKLHDQSLEDIVTVLQQHFEPKPLVISERFNFNRRQQEANESVADYVAALRKLSTHCQFGAFLDDALRDRFVCGLRYEATQKKLLVEAKLTFSGAVEIAKSMESAAFRTKQLQSHIIAGGGAQLHREVNLLTPTRGTTNTCYRCGKPDHQPTQCPFKNLSCHNCGKLGHIRPACRQLKKQSELPSPKKGGGRVRGRFRGRGRGRSVKTVEEEELNDMPFDLNNIRQVSDTKDRPYTVDLKLNGIPLEMEIDTGACMSLISEQTAKWLFPKKDLKPSKARLTTYSGEPITSLGETDVDVSYGTQQATLPLIVVSGTGPSLLGRNWLTTIRLDWKSIGSVSHQTHLSQLLDKYSSVFKKGLGKLVGHKAKLHVDPGAQPRYCVARPLPYALRNKVEAELDRLQSEGIIQPVQFADWAAPIVPVLKADKESLRICGDFKLTVNKASKLDRYPIPKIEDLFSKLAGGRTFSKLDMSQAYQQIPLDQDSCKYVVINTHRGLFQFNRLPFGVSSAPGVFQRIMESILNGVPNVVVYLDDILVTGPTEAEHLQVLEEVLQRLQTAGLRLKREKCVFMAPSVAYLGHKIDAQGLHPLPDKVRAIQEAPQPQNVSELKAYLGLLSYYSKFLPNLSTVLAPLYRLLRDDQPWMWKKPQEEAFQQSKEMLLSSQVLVHFDPTREIRLACDASDYGIGAVLSHRMPDGTEKPVGFASRTLSSAEKKYSQLEKEALACVFGVKRFHSYLWGHHFTLQTDHKPLLSLFGENKAIPQQAANRIQRWAWILASYEYTVTWRSTVQHANADALSRLPLQEVPAQTTTPAELVLMMEQLQDAPITATQIADWTKRDPLLATVLRYVRHGWPTASNEDLKPYWHRRTELSTEAGCLLWGVRVVVPPPGRESVLTELHTAHPGVSRMKSLARGLVWWPGIDASIEKMVKQCQICQQNQSSPPVAPLQPWNWPTRPWSRLHIDFAGPVEGKMVLIVIDAHSKWIEAIPVSAATSSLTIQQLRKLFAQFGVPDTVVSDNGTQFTANEFREFCESNGIRHTRVAPYHPSSNGLAERAVRIVKEGLRKVSAGTMMDRLSRFLFQYRITPQTTTGIAPGELLMGRKLKSPLDCLKPVVEDRVTEKQNQQKASHDKKAKPRQFSRDDQVLVRNHAQGPKWLPGVVVEESGPLSYRVAVRDGQIVRCHQDQLLSRDDGPQLLECTQPSESSEDDFGPESRVGDVPTPGLTVPSIQTDSSIDSQPQNQSSDLDTPGSELLASDTTAAEVATPVSTQPSVQSKTYPSRSRVTPDWYHKQYC